VQVQQISRCESPNQALNIELRDSRTIFLSFLLSYRIPLGARLANAKGANVTE